MSAPQPKKNSYDEHVKEVFTSKTFKIYITIFVIIFCVIPFVCLCLGMLGLFPLSSFINSLLQY